MGSGVKCHTKVGPWWNTGSPLGPVTALSHSAPVVPGYIWSKEKCFTISLYLLYYSKGKLTIELGALERSTKSGATAVLPFLDILPFFPLPKWYLVGVELIY